MIRLSLVSFLHTIRSGSLRASIYIEIDHQGANFGEPEDENRIADLLEGPKGEFY